MSLSLARFSRHRIIRADAGHMDTMSDRPDQFAAIHDDLAAHNRRHRPPRDLESFIRRVVGAMVQVGRGNDRLSLRIPDRNIRVGPDRDRTFARMQTIQLGVIGRGDGDEVVEGDSPFRDTLRKQDGQTRLAARDAVRHPAETRAAFGTSLPARSSYRNGQWSDENMWKIPLCSP